MIKFDLPNRDGFKFFLEEVNDELYRLQGPDLPYSVGYFDDGRICFVDVSGGNPIGIGSIFYNLIVCEIMIKDGVPFFVMKENKINE